jgi:hypothetical protein
MNKPLTFAAVAEAATGAALMVAPGFVARLLFGAELAGAGVFAGRMTGIALMGLGIACWPGASALAGMLTYGSVTTLYLAVVGLSGQWTGLLLWPAVSAHAVLSLLLGRALLRSKKEIH